MCYSVMHTKAQARQDEVAKPVTTEKIEQAPTTAQPVASRGESAGHGFSDLMRSLQRLTRRVRRGEEEAVS